MTVAATPKNYDGQRAKLREVMRRHGLQVVVLSSYQAVSYCAGTNILTQVTLPDRLAFLACFADGEDVLVVCSIEATMVRGQTDIADIAEYTEFTDDPTAVLIGVLKGRGLTRGRAGIEARRLQAHSYRQLQTELPSLTLVTVDEDVEELQTVKSAAEIEMLGQAARKTLSAVLAGVQSTSAGDSELSLCADIGSSMYDSGGMPVFTFFSTGERALGAHMEPIDRPLREGELWRIDLGGRFFELMNSDLARTGVVGEPSAEQEDILQDLLAIQAAGFRALEPGRPASSVYRAIEEEFARRKMNFQMPHIGHGLGIGLHEFPILQPANDAPLRAGMVLNIEPMFKAPERGECYHVEDLAVVTDNGYELLTQPQTSLIRIDA
jgi:Xaa-Pro aminopeptidase